MTSSSVITVKILFGLLVLFLISIVAITIYSMYDAYVQEDDRIEICNSYGGLAILEHGWVNGCFIEGKAYEFLETTSGEIIPELHNNNKDALRSNQE